MAPTTRALRTRPRVPAATGSSSAIRWVLSAILSSNTSDQFGKIGLGALLVNVYIINSDNLLAGVPYRVLWIIGAACFPPQRSVEQELGALHLAQQSAEGFGDQLSEPRRPED